jgi:N-carbamoylputrescine amidase
MRIAVVQLHCPPLDPGATAEATISAIDTAAAGGASLVVLPELATSGYVLDRAGLLAQAEGSVRCVGAWRAAARRHGVTIVGGTTEVVDGRLYNTAVVLDAAGEVVGRYRKLHLFGGEQATFDPGDLGLPVFDVGGLRLGVLICYDLRFPEAMRILALQGAQVVAVPTAWVGGFDRALPAPDARIGQVDGALVQANLNQVFVAIADQVGMTGPHTFLGRSLVIDPYGEPVLGPMAWDEPGVEIVEIDVAEAERAQNRGPGISPRTNRRTDVYGDLLGYRAPTP